jgi:sialate O-acetylesterase
VLFNGMIAPLTPAAIRGVIWYQGESNRANAEKYESLLTSLITDWRERFTLVNDKFPFGIVMLAGYFAVAKTPTQESGWTRVREAQVAAARKIPDVGVISAVDLGEANDIHPKNKQEVGARLARLMLNRVYGKSELVPTGPRYRSMKIAGAKIILSFDNIGGGLLAKDAAPLKWFAIAGADGKFVAGAAQIVGETVEVSAPTVAAPTMARYAWADNPEGANLYNQDGLPAFPFRTDAPKAE